jgi:hypothetical protein
MAEMTLRNGTAVTIRSSRFTASLTQKTCALTTALLVGASGFRLLLLPRISQRRDQSVAGVIQHIDFDILPDK